MLVVDDMGSKSQDTSLYIKRRKFRNGVYYEGFPIQPFACAQLPHLYNHTILYVHSKHNYPLLSNEYDIPCR